MSILQERHFTVDEFVPVASPRSAGRMLTFDGRESEVQVLTEDVFEGADLALFDVDDVLSKEWAPVAAEAGAIVVDNSAAWRMDPDVPLVVPEINRSDAARRPRGIIASPNCTTLAMIVPLSPLHQAAGLQRLIVSSYQSTSGSGRAGVDDLWNQTEVIAKEPDLTTAGLARKVLAPGNSFPHPIAMNVIPRCGSQRQDGYTSEELKLCDETRKIMHLPHLRVTATCVRVPVVTGHGVSVHAEFARPITPNEARSILSGAPGVEVVDDLAAEEYPTPLEAAGKDACYVGRIRQDRFDQSALEMFCVADNLRKGAALNTVQIAELLVETSGG